MCWSLKPLVIFVTVEHAYHWKMQCPRWHSIPGPLALQATALPTELKKISTNAVSRGGYEPTTVSITLGRGEFTLHSPHPKSHHTLTISQISKINPTSFPVQITVGTNVTVEHAYHWKMQCPRWHSIPGPLALQATALPTELKEISTNAVSGGGYESTKVPITLGRGAFLLHIQGFI